MRTSSLVSGYISPLQAAPLNKIPSLYEVAALILTTLVRTPGVPDISFFIYQGIQGDLGGVPDQVLSSRLLQVQ